MDWHTLPGTGIGASVRAAYLGARWLEPGVALGYWAPRRFWLVDRRTAGASVSMVGASVFACAAVRRPRVEARACPTVEMGAVRARSVGLSRGRVVWQMRPAVALRAQLAWVMAPRLAVTVDLTPVVPLVRYRFAVSDVAAVYRAHAVAVRAGLGLQLRW